MQIVDMYIMQSLGSLKLSGIYPLKDSAMVRPVVRTL